MDAVPEPLPRAQRPRAGTRLRPRRNLRYAAVAIDLAMLTLAAVATAIGADAAGVVRAPVAWTLAFCGLLVVLLLARGFDSPALGLPVFDDVRRVVVATALAAAVLLAAAAILEADRTVVDELLRLWLFATAYVSAGRVALYRSVLQSRREGAGLRPTLIVGAGRVGRLTARRLLESPQFGLEPIGFLDKDPLAGDGRDAPLPVLGASWDLEQVVAEHGVEQVVVTFSSAPDDVLLRLVRRCEELGVAIAMVPRLYERTTVRLSVDHLGGLPLVAAHASDPRGWQFAIKHAADRVAGLALVVLLAPVLVAAAVATYVSVGRPILFRQRRVGRDGVEFDMFKFRTMRGSPADRGELDAEWARLELQEAEAELDAVVPLEDPRTRVGILLRRTSIDELPQLLNVLLGQMSLVGPRPERTHYVTRFERNLYRYGERHRAKPGITGWAQVNGLRGQTSLQDRIEWDNYYIENFSLWLDVKILLRTVVAVFSSSRASG